MISKANIFVDDFRKLVDSCVSFIERNKDEMNHDRIRERRGKLSFFVEAFHRDCGTLTPSVQKRIEDLRSGKGVVLMTAHQPNLFAYGGVFRKATLNFVLAKKLEEMLEVPVVCFFGIADQDFTDDRWVRSCQLPAVQRTDGVLTIDAKLPEKLMLSRVAKPSAAILEKWGNDIEIWLNDAIESVVRLCRELRIQEVQSASCSAVLNENFKSFWNVVEGCYKRSNRYSDFNAFVMSKIVNEIWGYDTLFSRFSECQQAFVDEFGLLLSHFEDYSRLLKEAEQMPTPYDEGVSGGVSEQEPWLVPFWYHCDCGSKVKLFLSRNDGRLSGSGNCEGCQENYKLEFGTEDNPTLKDIAQRISARAIPMGLVFFNGLMPACYVGGVGGIRYLMEAHHVAEGLSISFPPVALWRPHDEYLGVGQVEALLELKRSCGKLGVGELSKAKEVLKSRLAEVNKRLDELEGVMKKFKEELCKHPDDVGFKEKIKEVSLARTALKKASDLSVLNHELKIVENVSTVLGLMPSIIDYAVNVGLKETSARWIRHLSENGSLSFNVHLESVLDQEVRLDNDLLVKAS